MTLLLLGGVFFFSACSDDFLNRILQDAPGPDNFLKDEASAKQLVVTAYSPWVQETQMYGKRFITICDGLTDDSGIRFGPSYIQNWDILPIQGDDYPSDWWKFAYQSVNAANYAIEQIPKLKDMGFSDTQIDPYIAEARFLRGFDYLFLTTFYGDVPLITEPLTSFAEFSKPRVAVADVFEQIISDFTFAKDHLTTDGGGYKGTPTQATAAAYLAKAYLYKKDYPACETAARAAITLAEATGYQLIDDYASIFDQNNEANPELLFYFAFEANKSINGTNDGNCWSVERGIRSGERGLPLEFRPIVQGQEGWGYALPTRNLYDAFEDGDPRRTATIFAPGDDYGVYNGSSPFPYQQITYISGVLTTTDVTYRPGDMVKYEFQWSPTGMNVKKLVENTTGINFRMAGLDAPLLRMADLYLFLAEALAEQEKDEALVWVNKVRKRAFGDDAHAKTKADGSLRDIVRHERRVELAMEGHRIFDLFRWDAIKKIFGNGGEQKVKLHFFSDERGGAIDGENGMFKTAVGLKKYPTDHILFPIPQYEMDQNAAITSNNPGY
ncbi:RagB/SusD family nutrient uptake outer membrane protein [termite gut metagenome]|uniref:RagB/SusD family nutrient uptake outer membrane protein n=1 Tax=termite gut metagenome TaxID=433724 RepID=A0A5J4RFA2_9ZZZZ